MKPSSENAYFSIPHEWEDDSLEAFMNEDIHLLPLWFGY